MCHNLCLFCVFSVWSQFCHCHFSPASHLLHSLHLYSFIPSCTHSPITLPTVFSLPVCSQHLSDPRCCQLMVFPVSSWSVSCKVLKSGFVFSQIQFYGVPAWLHFLLDSPNKQSLILLYLNSPLPQLNTDHCFITSC